MTAPPRSPKGADDPPEHPLPPHPPTDPAEAAAAKREARAPFGAAALEDGGFWVFGYGSLIWNPGFPARARRLARLPGYARRFCMTSIHYRGTPERPGLVLALDAAPAETHGVAFRVAPEHADETREYLAERELVSSAYREVVAEILIGEEAAPALTYVVDRTHTQYAEGLTLETQALVIARSVGPKGPNAEYLFNTVERLRAEGLSDAELGDLAELEDRVRRLLDR